VGSIGLRRAYVTHSELDLAIVGGFVGGFVSATAGRAGVLGLDRALIRSEYRRMEPVPMKDPVREA